MKKLILGTVLAIVLMFTMPALACAGNNYHWGDNHTANGGDGGNASAIANGGAGGQGGSATIEKGAVNNSNRNTNMNTNINSNKNENKNTNTNLNCNKNTNVNTQGQVQGQLQGQAQGQLQGQAQTAHNEGVEQNITINEAETKREHINGNAFKAGAGKYNDKYKYGAEFLPVSLITAIKKNFSFAAAYEDYGRKYGEDRCKTTGHSYNGRHENDPSKSIDVFTVDSVVDIEKDFRVVGFLTVKAVEDGTDSFMVMQKAILSACLMKGDAIVVTSEGAAFKPKSTGWGIGTFFTGGQVADHNNRGNATSAGGGTGFSSTSAELVTLPWMTVQVLQYK